MTVHAGFTAVQPAPVRGVIRSAAYGIIAIIVFAIFLVVMFACDFGVALWNTVIGGKSAAQQMGEDE